MNAGRQTIEWLYSTQLQIDDDWAVRRPDGFAWWACQSAQTIEIIGEQEGPDGQTGYLIRVRTDMVDDLDLTDRAADDICTGPMQTAALAGPVYDAATRRLSLCSLTLVHDENAQWMRILLSAAAAIQLTEAMLLGPGLAEQLGGAPAVSAHPDSGLREVPDEIALSARVFAEDGQAPCRWTAEDFDEAVQLYMMQPPSLGASSGGNGLTVEFPYGGGSSLCQMGCEDPHPLYGSGLFILQRFPFSAGSKVNGARLALALNADDLSIHPAGYGFGSYTYRDDMVCFSAFIPHALKGHVTLANLYYSCAARARLVADRLVGRP
ncbi:MAG: hypothetical protein KIH64_002155 [Mycobacterium sp.]|nr:hypothetical protein [Mycobacterium sp.]